MSLIFGDFDGEIEDDLTLVQKTLIKWHLYFEQNKMERIFREENKKSQELK